MFSPSSPDFTRRWWFWPLIALIAALFVLTMVMAVNAANRAADQEAAVHASCAPAFLQQIDREQDGTASLPALANLDDMLDQLDHTDDTTNPSACAAP